MFVQVIQGKARDKDGLKAQTEKWQAELAPGATGYLGSTAGVADDGTFVAIARFESEQAAQANSDRPEQGAWWGETEAHLEGDVTFANCPEVDTFGAGGSDDAGFVQVIQGRADREQVAPVARELDSVLRDARPDVIGGIVAWPGDGSYTQVIYFTSEDEARKGERAEMTPEQAEAMGRVVGLMNAERFVDLRDPWLASAG